LGDDAYMDKRRHERIAIKTLEMNNQVFFAKEIKIRDISITGIVFESHEKMDINSQYTLELRGKNKALPLQGMVVRSLISEYRRNPAKQLIPIYTIAIQFNDISDKVAELIQLINFRSKKIQKKATLLKLNGLRLCKRVTINDSEKDFISFHGNYAVKEISFGGMLLESEDLLEIDNKLPMEISIPEDKPLKVVGRVVRHTLINGNYPLINDKDLKKYHMGIEFIDMSEKYRAMLNKLVTFAAIDALLYALERTVFMSNDGVIGETGHA
jgi:hypothetical protein